MLFTPPQPWALGFAAPPRMPFVGDVDGDGRADLIVVYPQGDSIVDVNLTVEGLKSGGGFQALPKWAGPCRAAAVGEFDGKRGADVVGLFGDTLRLAGGYGDGRFRDERPLAKLPRPLAQPVLASVEGGKAVLAFSTRTGEGFRVETATGKTEPLRLPRGIVWLGDAEAFQAVQTIGGEVRTLKAGKLDLRLGKAGKGSRPAVGRGWVAFGATVWSPEGETSLTPSKLPDAVAILASGDVDGDGDEDLVEFRYGKEPHTGNEVLLRRAVSPGGTDADHDGLSDAEEAKLGTDPLNTDTDDDGLLDGWEVWGYRGLDLPKLGCDPRHADVVCLVSRFEGVDPSRFEEEMKRVRRFYAELPAPNPNGKAGLNFVRVDLDPIKGEDQKASWQANLAKFRPQGWRGVVHWMQVTPGGGGQADELGDGGTCGVNALWAVFTHEFGHQLGLNHEGFWPNGSCPIYSSMMNYNYSYGFEDDREKIHYSDGRFKGYVLRENDLDETLPLPLEKVRFLSMGPYRYRLKANGDTTLIDWNWNGVFGEKHIRADINYAYSTNAGTRDTIGKTSVAPWLFTHHHGAFILSGEAAEPRALGTDPTLSEARPGALYLRRMIRPTEWEAPWKITDGLVGDPVAISLGGEAAVFAPTASGVRLFRVDPSAHTLHRQETLPDSKGLVPTVGQARGKPTLMLWNPATGAIQVMRIEKDGVKPVATLDAKSVAPPGMCMDTKSGETVVALAQNQDPARPNRWQIRRYDRDWKETGMDWVEGEGGGARGVGRLTALFDASRDAGPKGRVFVFGKGMTDAKTPWACTYVAMTIADRSVRGGWLVKREYDEWTQSRSAPAAVWFGGDILWAYRWQGGEGASDDDLQVGYKGLGIQSEPFGDFDDIGFVRNFGLRHSLLSLGRG